MRSTPPAVEPTRRVARPEPAVKSRSRASQAAGPAKPAPAATAARDPLLGPVVGWLAVIAGPGQGEVLPLNYGVNDIGRGAKARVRLDFGDAMIATDNQAAIIYYRAFPSLLSAVGRRGSLVERPARSSHRGIGRRRSPATGTDPPAVCAVVRAGFRLARQRIRPGRSNMVAWMHDEGMAQGSRPRQEDDYGVFELPPELEAGDLLLVLADGMGGEQAGALASALAVRGFIETYDAVPAATIPERLERTLSARERADGTGGGDRPG
ncbi:MAG: hypothetical protein MZU84_05455 [Sphingobacterium sp.]|nr:hypothetical protein [Sphingobacterium sp.]